MADINEVTIFYRDGKCTWVKAEINGESHLSADVHNDKDKIKCVFSSGTRNYDPLLLECIAKIGMTPVEGEYLTSSHDDYLHVLFNNTFKL